MTRTVRAGESEKVTLNVEDYVPLAAAGLGVIAPMIPSTSSRAIAGVARFNFVEEF